MADACRYATGQVNIVVLLGLGRFGVGGFGADFFQCGFGGHNALQIFLKDTWGQDIARCYLRVDEIVEILSAMYARFGCWLIELHVADRDRERT